MQNSTEAITCAAYASLPHSAESVASDGCVESAWSSHNAPHKTPDSLKKNNPCLPDHPPPSTTTWSSKIDINRFWPRPSVGRVNLHVGSR